MGNSWSFTDSDSLIGETIFFANISRQPSTDPDDLAGRMFFRLMNNKKYYIELNEMFEIRINNKKKPHPLAKMSKLKIDRITSTNNSRSWGGTDYKFIGTKKGKSREIEIKGCEYIWHYNNYI